MTRWLAALLVLLASSAAAQLVGECPPGQVAILQDGAIKGCGPLDFPTTDFSCTATPAGITCGLAAPGIGIDISTQGVECKGTSDATSAANTALLANVGKVTYLRPGCRIGLGSPGLDNSFCTASGNPLPCCSGANTGTCHVAVTLPAHTHLYCADNTAGFFAVRKRCKGGTYLGAACSTDAECIGGTTGDCAFDFGSSVFAPTSGDTYIMLKDAAGGTDIQITNCSIWTYQADGYQRCNGTGGNAGKPCRQECTGTVAPGTRCEQGGSCFGGSCQNLADCGGAGGTGSCGGAPCCNGAPLSAVGSGKIDPLDLARTTNTSIVGVKVRDHFNGDFGIKPSYTTTITDTDVAAELTDCTSPLSSTPANSFCLAASAGSCCYGAATFTSSNTQPTTAVTNGIFVTSGAKLTRVRARGSIMAITGVDKGVVDDSDVIPAASTGPGTASGGINVLTNSVVSQSRILFLASGATGITLGQSSTALADTIMGVGGAGIGIAMAGAHAKASYNYIEGNGATGIGINVATDVDKTSIEGNTVASNAVDLLQYGIAVQNGADETKILGNSVVRVHDACFAQLGSGFHVMISGGNSCELTPLVPTAALHPIHVYNAGFGNHMIVDGNVFRRGWRGYATGPSASGLTNTLISKNRFTGLFGAPVAAGGAGLVFDRNYINFGGDIPPGNYSLTCDASCTTRGAVCQLDSDCTGCAGAVHPCIPEPVNAFIGSPVAQQGSSHNQFTGNVMFNNGATLKQCTVAGPIGQRCDVASCAGGVACSGGPPATCASGTDAGKFCCQTAAGATCAIRDPTVHVRVLDQNMASPGANILTIAENTFFGGGGDVVDIDMQSTAALGNIVLRDVQITANNFDAATGGTTTAIRFPTSFSSITGMNVSGNGFSGFTTDVANWRGTFGALSFVPMTMSLHADQSVTSTSFTDVTDGTAPVQLALAANRAYFFNCEPTFSSAALTTGVAFAMSYSGTPTTFTYISRLPTAAIETGPGTDTMTEQEGNANDDTAVASNGVGGVGTKYMANVRGNIVTSTAGNLTLRAKRANTDGAITIYAGANCAVTQMP